MISQNNVRVLIADDDYLACEKIREQAESAGYTVVGTAIDGLEAIELTKSLQPDVVLMDIKMPRMDGLEAAQQIQNIYPTPIVLVTAYQTPELVVQAVTAGVGAYLTKPPTTREIERSVSIAIARFDDMIKLRRLNGAIESRNKELQASLATVKTLTGLLPICANCKKIRGDEGYWHDVAAYIRDHSDAELSHGICPDCMDFLYSSTE